MQVDRGAREVVVDGRAVEFRIALQSFVPPTWNHSESKIHPPTVTLTGACEGRTVVLQKPATRSRISAYSDDELRDLWREKMAD